MPLRYLILITAFIGMILVVVYIIGNTERGNVVILFRITDLAEADEVTVTVENIDVWGEQTGWRASTIRESMVHASWAAEYTNVASGRMRAGRYERIRLDGVHAKIQSAEHNTDVLTSLSPVLLIDIPIVIETEKTSAVLIDISYDRSRYRSETGRLVFVPTVRVESRGGVALERTETGTRVSGGTLYANSTYGMTADGTMRVHFRLPDDTRFSWDQNELFVVPPEPLLSPVDLLMHETSTSTAGIQKEENTAVDEPANQQ